MAAGGEPEGEPGDPDDTVAATPVDAGTARAGAGGDPDGAETTDAGAGEDDAIDAKRMTLLEHLDELRRRLRNAFIAFAVSMFVAFFFVQEFFEYLTRPVRMGLKRAGHEVSLHAVGVTEPFWVYMKLAIVAGIIIASPLVFWEMWKFVAPGLYKKEKKLAGLITGATALCFMGGAFFGYAALTEPAAYYLMGLLNVHETSGPVEFTLKPILTMEHVANFLMLTLAGCGVAFELPVVIALLGWIGMVSARGLFRFNKYALVLSAVLGGVLTPSTDPFTQVLLAGPIFLLYNVSILVVWAIERARRKQEAAQGL